MTLAELAVAVLGACTGFASTVWAIVGWSSIRARHWWPAFSYASLIIVNLISTIVIVSGLLVDHPVDHPIGVPRGSVTLILIPLIILPPMLQLRSWLATRHLIHGQTSPSP